MDDNKFWLLFWVLVIIGFVSYRFADGYFESNKKATIKDPIAQRIEAIWNNESYKSDDKLKMIELALKGPTNTITEATLEKK